MSLIEVNNLGVQFQTQDGLVYAVNGINFALKRGQTLGIVGESGSGKSQSVLAMMGLLAGNGKATGQALYKGQDLLAMKPAELNKIRGNRVAMIFQDPMTSLNPYLTVERQMTEVLQFHKGFDRKAARARSVQLLDAVKISLIDDLSGAGAGDLNGRVVGIKVRQRIDHAQCKHGHDQQVFPERITVEHIRA